MDSINSQQEETNKQQGQFTYSDDATPTSKGDRQQQQIFDCIFNNVREAIIIINVLADETFCYQNLNSVAQRLRGLENVTGKTLTQVLPLKTAAAFEQSLRQCLHSQESISYQECILARGQDTWWLTSLDPVRDDKGNIYCIVVRSIDITEQQAAFKELEQAQIRLNQEKKSLQTLLDNLADGVVACDRDGKLTLFNETTRKIHGLPVEDIPPEAWAEHYNLYQPDGQTLLSKEEIPLYRGLQGESARGIKLKIIPKQGQPRTILANCDPITNDNGEKIGAIATMTDISKKEATEAELEKERVFIKAMLDSLSVGIVACDENGILALFNKSSSEIFGMPVEPLPPEQWSEYYSLYYPDGKTLLKQEDIPLFRAFVGETFIDAELMAVPKNGRARNLLSNGCPIIDQNGVKLGAVVTARDFTRQKLAEDALAQLSDELGVRFEQPTSQAEKVNSLILIAAKRLRTSNRELEQFARVISHDLKAPLRAIRNLSEWIAEDLEDKLDAETRHNLNLLKSRVYRLENLIDSLLAYSRIGRSDSQLKKVSVAEMLEDIIDSLDSGYDIRIEGQMPTFVTEATPLQQVFSNLITNAIKYSDRKDIITISVAEQAKFYSFAVTDNGQGIAPKNSDKIFNIFNTVAAKDDTDSTGIGLSIVKKAVENQGGTIEVRSQLGKGATFTFTWKK